MKFVVLVFAIVVLAVAQTNLTTPVYMGPANGAPQTGQVDQLQGQTDRPCKTLKQEPTDPRLGTVGVYRVCVQNNVMQIDFGSGYSPVYPTSFTLTCKAGVGTVGKGFTAKCTIK